MADVETIQSVGRRKSAVARVAMKPGSGNWSINGRALDEYFTLLRYQEAVRKPLVVTGTEDLYDIRIRVSGGGPTGQAEAVRMAVARAVLTADEDRRSVLRAHDLLTRDPRIVERKKPGQPKARKRFQFSKR